MHSARLMAALTRFKLLRWPFAGPALLAEGDTAHVIDRWRYLGSARCEADVWALSESRGASFDRDTYRALVKAAGQMKPLPANGCAAAPAVAAVDQM